ncbi:lysozyme inhibitor LprI family protein [Panacagrimonas sp.]|uniref:lysozyme inhibitor LprI family protein n=1 Tax=Panacagrimonas sp. TaxID=2480088 RepID=UPI003B51FF51
MKQGLTAVFLILAISTNAVADNSLLTKQFSLCMDNSGGVTAAMLDCVTTETAIQDARLNSAYRKLRGQLSDARKAQLLATQRIWIQFRDANCGFYADPEGGTMAAVSGSDCVLQATASRAKELERFLE